MSTTLERSAAEQRNGSGCANVITWLLGLVAVFISSSDMLTIAGAIMAAGAVIADAIVCAASVARARQP